MRGLLVSVFALKIVVQCGGFGAPSPDRGAGFPRAGLPGVLAAKIERGGTAAAGDAISRRGFENSR